ncbi:MAG TPA: diadenylate cyclase CdaA [Anaerolineaceae bacterium]|jgi:diadenylate cyclase|nr:diadenylate cyclase CdaA [Anaerolineaceae bacterium]
MKDIISEIVFLFQRFSWLTIFDLLIVSLIFYAILRLLHNTQARTLFRGMIFVVIIIMLLTTLVDLPAFSYLVQNTLPAMFLAIPVIFAPEIRRALERVGRAGPEKLFARKTTLPQEQIKNTISAVAVAVKRLSSLQHGALIVFQVADHLQEYIETGVAMSSKVSAELILQIFYPNTPLHDGAVIITADTISAASCVLPLSSMGILNKTPDNQMGLRHRAALGITESTDAVAVVVSEETGDISIAHLGKMIREVKSENLETALFPFLLEEERLVQSTNLEDLLRTWLGLEKKERKKE